MLKFVQATAKEHCNYSGKHYAVGPERKTNSLT